MCNRTPIFFKPDALSGEFAFADPTTVRDFIECLVAYLRGCPLPSSYYLQDPTSINAAITAFKQSTERAATESSFAAPVRREQVCERNLRGVSAFYTNVSDRTSTRIAIERAVCSFGYRITRRKTHIITLKDIESIYHQAIKETPLLKEGLRGYLENKKILLILLEGDQEISALQVIKTYARYFFRYRPGEQHRLENLMHVPDQTDAAYLSGLL